MLGVERVWFSDTSLAVDFFNADGSDGNATTLAKVLGVTFGPDALGNQQVVGIGLHFLDNGLVDYRSLMELALDVRLGAGYTSEQLVVMLFQNVAGFTPDAATVAEFSQLIGPGGLSPVDLAIIAADLDLNLDNIGLVGLQQSGLAYELFTG